MERDLDPDLQLVTACRNPGQDAFEAAFEALYHRYRDRAYSIAYRITGKSADAMDVVQEAFGLVFRKIEGFRGESLFSTWLFRIVVNCAIDSNRGQRTEVRKRTSSLSQMGGTQQPMDDACVGPEEAAEIGELGEHVQRTIQKLSPKLRAILVLRYLEHLNYDQLCVALDVSMGTVKSRLARAHAALQTELAGTLEPFGFQAESDGKYSSGPGREGVA